MNCLLWVLLSYCFGLGVYAQSVGGETQNLPTGNPLILSPEALLRQKAFKNPQDLDSAKKLLDIYQQSGRLRTANHFLDQMMHLNPNLPLAFLQRGVNDSLAARDYLKVVQFTRMVNAKEPQNADNLNSMGFALYNLKQYGVARGAFEISVHLDPQNYRALTNLARDLEALGDTQKAQELYQKALVINPNYQLAKRNLSKLQHPTPKKVPSFNHPARKKAIDQSIETSSTPSSEKAAIAPPQNMNSSNVVPSSENIPVTQKPVDSSAQVANISPPEVKNTPLAEKQNNSGEGEKN